MFAASGPPTTMPEHVHQKLRAIVEDIHEAMMRALVDAPADEHPPRILDMEDRIAECGFGASSAVASSFQRVCERVLAADLNDEDVILIVEACLRSASPDAAIVNLERYLESTGSVSVFLRTMLAAPPVLNLVTTVFGASQHLADILVRQPGFVYWLMEQSTWDAPDDVDSFSEWLAREVEAFRSVEGKLNAVRRAHRQALLKIGVLDMVSGASVEEVTRRLSDLADAIARTVLDVVFDELGDDAQPRGIAVIAMGKLGGRELNYSSDIDLIFACQECDDDTLHFYTRVARRFADAMSALTEEGYLYRVDLRLRPDGKAGPLVNTEQSLLIYYENRGRPWEFQAMMKARAIAGDLALGERFLDSIGKLIYSSALPYSPLEAVGAMRDQIKENLRANQRGHNIKLMAGGIRDIEFVAQAGQIMHAPQHKELRTPNTLVSLSTQRRLKLLKEWDADNLMAAYRFFRLVEHRLQMMHQLQTHTLPDSDEEIALLARRVSHGPLGSFTTESFIDTLSRHLNNVRAFADAFFAGESVHPHSVLLMLPEDSERAVTILRQVGIRDVPRAMRTLHGMAYGSFPRLLDRRARAEFEKLLPFLLEDVAATGDPDTALVRVAQVAAAEKSESSFYGLLVDSPAARRLLVGIAGMSSLLTRELCAQIGVLDSLIGDGGEAVDQMLAEVPEWERFSARDAFARGSRATTERRERQRQWFERLRLLTFAESFRNGFHPGPHGITGEKARAAGARVHLAAAFDEMVPEKERVAVFVMGSYGVGEPRITSDLDLLVVADGVDLPDLMQRVQAINQWFTDGRILKLDFRLRAEGASSPLVQDLAFYDEYFKTRASLWERVAFAKCSPWWGGEKARLGFLRKLRAFVARPFSAEEITALAQMRARVEGLAPKKFVEWDTKRSAGGRYDIEYILAVGMAGTCMDRVDFFTMSTHERIDALLGTGYLTADEGALLRDGVDLFTRVEHFMELQEMSHPGTEEKARWLEQHLARVSDETGTPASLAALTDIKTGVRGVYTRHLDQSI
jgi:glutamate-ammonia-ligase adenylyltransferase